MIEINTLDNKIINKVCNSKKEAVQFISQYYDKMNGVDFEENTGGNE